MQLAYATGGTDKVREKGWEKGNYSITDGNCTFQHLNISNVSMYLKSSHSGYDSS